MNLLLSKSSSCTSFSLSDQLQNSLTVAVILVPTLHHQNTLTGMMVCLASLLLLVDLPGSVNSKHTALRRRRLALGGIPTQGQASLSRLPVPFALGGHWPLRRLLDFQGRVAFQGKLAFQGRLAFQGHLAFQGRVAFQWYLAFLGHLAWLLSAWLGRLALPFCFVRPVIWCVLYIMAKKGKPKTWRWHDQGVPGKAHRSSSNLCHTVTGQHCYVGFKKIHRAMYAATKLMNV